MASNDEESENEPEVGVDEEGNEIKKPKAKKEKKRWVKKKIDLFSIALFTVSFSHLHYYVIRRVCEEISGYNYKIAGNYLTFMLDYNVMQRRKVNREKGYWLLQIDLPTKQTAKRPNDRTTERQNERTDVSPNHRPTEETNHRMTDRPIAQY